jgi:16S rRNA G1207 methylase RsmC
MSQENTKQVTAVNYLSMKSHYNEALETFGNKKVDFRFRNTNLSFTLSHGIFSSADIDSGTRFLLKVLSKTWDDDIAANRPLPSTVLDAGSGVGVIGVAIAAALKDAQKIFVRCQDRDELAKVFTEANARCNNIADDILQAYAEPLLTCPPQSTWDLIISNIPAKTGKPVLQDFVRRSADLLSANGKVFIVIVNPLAQIFREWILEAELNLLYEEAGKEHTVFVYNRNEDYSAKNSVLNISSDNSPYIRHEDVCELEGQVFPMRTFHGAADFDNPGILIQHTAKLITKMNLAKTFASSNVKILVHEQEQGHLPIWMGNYFGNLVDGKIILSGRNIISLKASQYNCEKNNVSSEIFSAIDFGFNQNKIEQILCNNNTPRLIITFPKSIPTISRWEANWEGLAEMLRAGDICIIGLSSVEADRFDKVKSKNFSRMNELKRSGFRVIAYKRN